MAKEAFHIAVSGDNADDLQQQLQKKEDEIDKLKRNLQNLQTEARKQKGGNNELKQRIKQKEAEINIRESQLSQLRKRLLKLQKQQNNEWAIHDETVAKLKNDIELLKGKNNNLKGRLLQKDAADNNAREKIRKLNEEIDNLKSEIEQLKKTKRK